MKNVWNYLAILISMNVSAQNLVPNPSFEVYDTCPNSVNQIYHAAGWSTYRLTPDYLNSCSGISLVGVPSNWAGYQYARTGDACIGLYTYYSPGQSPRECIGVELLQPLIQAHRYFVSFYVSRAKNIFQYVNIASNKLGAKFSIDTHSFANPIPLNNYAQVYTDSIITDTLNWTQISGNFISDSAYQYLSIGNFFDDAQTSVIRFDSTSAFAYYYIDDILVVDSTVLYTSDLSANSHIKVFPNPFHDELFIEGNKIEMISVFDILGRKYFDLTPGNSPSKLNTENLPEGIYILNIKTTGQSFYRSEVKQE